MTDEQRAKEWCRVNKIDPRGIRDAAGVACVLMTVEQANEYMKRMERDGTDSGDILGR